MVVLPLLALAALLVLYGRKKVEKRLFFLILCGNLLGLGLTVKETLTESRRQVTELEKGEQGSGGSEILLEVETEDGEKAEISLRVPEQTLTEAGTERLLTEKLEELDEIILGENPSFSRVGHDLYLPSDFQDSPVTVQWSTDNPQALNWDGAVGDGAEESGTRVNLTGVLSLQGRTEEYRRLLTVYPSAEEETLEQAVQREAERLNGQEESGSYRLPEEIDGRRLAWYLPAEQTGVLVSGLSLAAGALALLSRRRREEREALKRKEELQRDYPEIVSKVQLLAGAGLTMRKAFERMAEDYRAEKEAGHARKTRAAYEEIVRVCREMQSGTAETEAYEHLGERCGTAAYRGLSLLLVQNLKKGSQGLLPVLEQEAQAAFEARKRNARAEGEKAAVRLLLPMSLMLLVVLVILMVPALLSF